MQAAILLTVVLAVSASAAQDQCSITQRPPPVATLLPKGEKRLAGRMDVLLADAPNPFWFAVPPPEDLPGYYIDSFRATRMMCPSLSVIFHHLLHERCKPRTTLCAEEFDEDRSRPLVVDVGAHLGWFSFLAASYGCRVIAVEPQPHAALFINATIALNGWQDRIRLVSAAIGEVEGQVRIINEAPNDWAVASTVPLDNSNQGDIVRAVRIDSLVDEEILLLKIDTEGLEYNSIRSASRLLERNLVENIVVETKPEDDGNLSKRSLLKSMLLDGWNAYTFYEEVFRTVSSWNFSSHAFPLFKIDSFDNWPESQLYQDHVFLKHPLPQPHEPRVDFLFPPENFVFSTESQISCSIVLRAAYPSKTKLRLFLNDNNVGEYSVRQDGPEDRPDYSRLDIGLPKLDIGEYTIVAVAVHPEGEEISDEAAVTFSVSASARAASHSKGYVPHWFYHIYGASFAP